MIPFEIKIEGEDCGLNLDDTTWPGDRGEKE